MATKLGQKELKLIAYLLGIKSKEIQTCKLICKSWNFHFTQIVPSLATNKKQKVDNDEKEEEKSYTPRKQYSSIANYNPKISNTINIQRSQLSLVNLQNISISYIWYISYIQLILYIS